jgi:hypothetical protein
MIFQPAILALTLADGIALVFLTYAAIFAIRLLKQWDLGSGHGIQLKLEQRTYLISTIVTFILFSQSIALLLFIFNADRMADSFVGAMCSVGSLNADPWGFPALILRLVLFFLASAWLVMNHLDNKHRRYPLTRSKYGLLLPIFLFTLITAITQLGYFFGLDGAAGATITSCCGSLFSVNAQTVASELSGAPAAGMIMLFYLTMTLTLTMGWWVIHHRRGYPLFAGITLAALGVGIASVISFLSLYIYEHPHHHCPFCLLKPEYHYFGYFLYIPLFAGTALSLGVGMSAWLTKNIEIGELMKRDGHRLIILATLLFALFTVIASMAIINSNLILLEEWW